VLAAIGYPGEYKKGFYIDHSDVIENNNLKIFHAGTTLKNNKFQSTGGRILTVNAYSDTKENALAAAYENIKKIKIYEDEDMKIQNQDLVFYREDIGN
jgi:phosphoribosylamine--glycine ligase